MFKSLILTTKYQHITYINPTTNNIYLQLQLYNNIHTVTLYTSSQCTLCIPVKYIINKVKQKYNFTYNEVDIYNNNNKQYYNLYKYDIPVVYVNNNEIINYRFIFLLC